MSETIEVGYADLKVGDYLVAYESIVTRQWEPVGKLLEQRVAGGCMVAGSLSFSFVVNRRYRVRKSVVPTASSNSRYPRQCEKCGKGLYIGMHEIDHEGGPCLKG